MLSHPLLESAKGGFEHTCTGFDNTPCSHGHFAERGESDDQI